MAKPPRQNGAAPQQSAPPTEIRPAKAEFLVVGIGASAGGLEACRNFLGALPSDIGMAFILVQHLDPTHESLMVELLASHTRLHVRLAGEGMKVEAGFVYVIPPGKYLSVAGSVLHLSQPLAAHGSRLPFDFLLQSLAQDFGARAICIVLSGTGADGSAGLLAVKDKGGLVIVQKPEEAEYGGMPRSAIATGKVDLVLPVAKIPGALASHGQNPPAAGGPSPESDPLHAIIALLRVRTSHDFTLYKTGTLQRRIERRMGMVSLSPQEMGKYLEMLQGDAQELALLAKDLLINVTSFFRDPKVFDYLSEKIIPGLVSGLAPEQPLRVWIAGCSTGEETYSLAMLFREAISASGRTIKLQVFASDVDADAVTSAREGLYPETIRAQVSPERLAKFFTSDDHGYRVTPELRAVVVFTVQDVLSDPPFSRIDLISCRNLLIYLGLEAQAKAIAAFHFALREGGILLLGSSETVAGADGRFEVVSKLERLYRRIGRSRPGDFGFSWSAADRLPARPGQPQPPSRQAALADLCRKLVLDLYAPAAILINRKHECLFSLGPTQRYLRVASGHPTHDLLAMAPQGLRNKLRSAIQQATHDNARIAVSGGHGEQENPFDIVVQPVLNDGDDLLLVCFVDKPGHGSQRSGKRGALATGEDVPRVAELERELEATKTELQGAIRNLELSSEDQKAINEEALSVNEEFQSTNEELLTSKEELQSLNEELTALNSQLQETLERARTTSNDLQNILYRTDVATLFLDPELRIRFFTPATKSVFNVIASDVGRPLADLNSMVLDGQLSDDANIVLKTFEPVEREIQADNGTWFVRRILPYRTRNDGVEGVVITFTDITERKHTAKALELAKQHADQANLAKSRFLAAASHDLRQPLQTLALLQGLLVKHVQGERATLLVGRLDETLGAMSGMLNTLLDINQIDSGTVHVEITRFPVNDLLQTLNGEFSYVAQAQGLALRVQPCSLSIQTDPRLLEQMIRNLLANALKYTRHGKVLLGCRRRHNMLSIEVWDTGIGIAQKELATIFEEYHQIDNGARERSRGLGLGLSIVQRLGKLLGHPVSVRSQRGKGSVFAIDVLLSPSAAALQPARPGLVGASLAGNGTRPPVQMRRTGTILLVEDEPQVRDLLAQVLGDEGHEVHAAADGLAALELVARAHLQPDLVLADFNLPNGMDGLETVAKLRQMLFQALPVIILTGDISTGTLSDISRQDCVRLSKPVRPDEMIAVIQRLLAQAGAAAVAGPDGSGRDAEKIAAPVARPAGALIHVVDDDRQICKALQAVLEGEGWRVATYATCEAFLKAWQHGGNGAGDDACLLVDAYLPGMSGIDLLRHLQQAGKSLPAIMITGNSDVTMAVAAMKAGACDFIEKPVGADDLVASVARALEQARDSGKLAAWNKAASARITGLTPRQHEIMDMVLAGAPSKIIAARLDISQRTVESHRAAIMKKTGAGSLPALARLALASAAAKPGHEPSGSPGAAA